MTLLPIIMHFVDIAEQLALQYASGSASPAGKGVGAMPNPYTMDFKLLPDWWKDRTALNSAVLAPRIPQPLTPTDPSVEENTNDGAVGEGDLPYEPPLWSEVVASLVHTTRLLERVHVNEAFCAELSEANDRVDIITPAFARVEQLQSGYSRAEPDEVTRNSSTRPGIVNCTTLTAFAQAEHREPMCNYFYS